MDTEILKSELSEARDRYIQDMKRLVKSWFIEMSIDWLQKNGDVEFDESLCMEMCKTGDFAINYRTLSGEDCYFSSSISSSIFYKGYVKHYIFQSFNECVREFFDPLITFQVSNIPYFKIKVTRISNGDFSFESTGV